MALLQRKETQDTNEKTVEINAEMQGTLSFKDSVNLKINGKFSGTLEVRGTLNIGNTAIVEAHINGDNIIVAGKVKGDIIAKKMLVLMPTGVLTGNIFTPKLNIVEGAIFQGQCQMMDEYLDVEEVAKYLEIETNAIVELANTGKIPATKTGATWKFERAEIDTWAAAGKVR